MWQFYSIHITHIRYKIVSNFKVTSVIVIPNMLWSMTIEPHLKMITSYCWFLPHWNTARNTDVHIHKQKIISPLAKISHIIWAVRVFPRLPRRQKQIDISDYTYLWPLKVMVIYIWTFNAMWPPLTRAMVNGIISWYFLKLTLNI